MGVRAPNRACFGPFELDPQSGELPKLDQKLSLHGQPVAVLSTLLQHPGELVTHKESCKRLWPQGTFVDFDHSPTPPSRSSARRSTTTPTRRATSAHPKRLLD